MKKTIILGTLLISQAYAGTLSTQANQLNELSQKIMNISQRIDYGNSRPRAKYRLSNKLQELIQTARAMKRGLNVNGGVVVPRPPVNPYPPVRPRRVCESSHSSLKYESFEKIKNFAYSTGGLDESRSGSVQFANDWMSKYPCSYADEYIQNLKRLKNFAYSTGGLDMSKSNSVNFALSKVDNLCVSFPLESEFKRHFNHAYSRSGLDLSKSQSIDYGLRQVSYRAFNCQNI